jgi:hypothetical protein
MFPSDWANQTGGRRKRRATDDPPQESPRDEPPPSAHSLDDLHLPRLILRNVNTASRAPATPAELDLDAILSRVPYREILENLYGRDTYPRPDVPVITRAYEESFLREPTGSERPCAAGELCECMFIDPCTPFVATEFLLPGEPQPPTPQFCIPCSRKVTQKLFYDTLFAGKEVHGLIQRYGNLCNVPGEYARECMLIAPPHAPLHCMPLPIMSHQRNKYRVTIAAGIKHLEQLRVRHEDFGSPLTEGQS